MREQSPQDRLGGTRRSDDGTGRQIQVTAIDAQLVADVEPTPVGIGHGDQDDDRLGGGNRERWIVSDETIGRIVP